MGGKPLKPKIQAYVEQRWFDEFEVYRASHNLNQSKALEKILSKFFSGSSKPVTELDTALAPTMIDAFRAELAEFKLGLEQRLQLVESRLAIESAVPLAKSASEPVPSLNRLAAESAIDQASSANRLNESAVVDSIVLDSNPVECSAELDAELAKKSAAAIDEEKTDLADELATVSAFVEATTALDESIESADSLANGSAIVESAIAVSSLEDIVETVAPDHEPLEESAPAPEQRLEPMTSLGLEKRLCVDNSTISRNKGKGNDYFREWSAKHDPDGIAWEYRKGESRKPQYFPLP